MLRFAVVTALLGASTAGLAQEPAGLHRALEQLTRNHQFSGAVVVRGADGVRFARGYGMADPFTGRRFTPDTPVDSGSLAKPVTAAAALMLVRDGKLGLDQPVQRYLPGYPHKLATVRHLLAHSAGLPLDQSQSAIVGKDNETLLADVRKQRRAPLFAPGNGFSYCNLCSITLAMLIERASRMHYLDFVRSRVLLPSAVRLRPSRLTDWPGRAIGYRRTAAGKPERADSYDDERFYGSANLSISASQLAQWGTAWWGRPLAPIRLMATTPATIGGNASGLSWGNWYCAKGGRRCHYLGHHEGFHHLLYWNGDRRIAVAMVSNNSLSPVLQQRLQRALVAFAESRTAAARRELSAPLPDRAVIAGRYGFPTGETVEIRGNLNAPTTVERGGIAYPAYPIGTGIRYVPGLDAYISGGAARRLHWLSLYESFEAAAVPQRR